MRRRAFLSTAAVAAVAGCSGLPDVGSSKNIGDSAEFGPLEVTTSDAMAADLITVTMADERTEIEAPPNGQIALFEIEVRNTDITPQEGPGVSLSRYGNMVEEENELVAGEVNDIRVFGSGEGGHLPEEVEDAIFEYSRIAVNGTTVETWPVDVSGSGPQIEPDGRQSGWVFGLIDAGTTPELKIECRGSSAMWTSEGTSLDTPTESTRLPM